MAVKATGTSKRAAVKVPAQLIASLVIFAYALFYTYKLKISPNFAYSGLTFRDPEPIAYATAIGLTAIVGLALPRTIGKVSDFILWVLFVLGVAPSILLAQYSRTLEPSEALTMALSITGVMLFAIFITSRPASTKPLIGRLEKGIDFWVILTVFSVLVYLALIVQTGLQFRRLSFEDVYDVRAEFGAAAGGSAAIGYLLPIQMNVVNPLFVVKGVTSRRLLPLLAGVIGQLIIYSTAGKKSTFFTLIVVVGIVLMFRHYKGNPVPGAAILLAATAASLAALAADQISGGMTWTSLISRRVMVIPGALTSAYIDVFGDRPRQNFAEVLPFAENPYPNIRPVNIVGAEFVGDPGTAANVNLFGHGYLQFGYLGMFIEGAILIVLLLVANRATREMPLLVSCVAFFGVSLALVSASVFTTVLTHGFIATIAICAIAPATTWHRQPRKPARTPVRTT